MTSPTGLPVIEVPVHDPVAIFALAMLVFLVAPLVLARHRLPGIVGIILVGAVIGPNALHVLERDDTIVLLGEVGLIYLLFVAGLEIDLDRFVERTDRSVVFGLLSFVIPQGVGTAFGVWVLGLSLPAALLFASIFASHTLLAYPIVSRLDVARNEALMAAIGGTILTDTLALLVLAVVVAAEQGVLGPTFWMRLSIGLSLLVVGVLVLVPRIGRWFFRNLAEESYFEFLFVMAVLFVCAFLAEVVGVEAIVGAFLAGLVLNRLVPESGPLMNRIEFVGNALLIPFFLLSVGMLVDVGVVVESVTTIVIGGSLVAMVLGTKWLAAWVTGRLYGFSRDEVRGMYGLSAGQASAALAIVLIGFEVGIDGFDREMVNGVVLMILVVSVLSPMIVERAATSILEARERSTYDPSVAPRRTLVPLSPSAEHSTSLFDLALSLREPRSVESLYALTVVEPGSDVDARIADAESSLAEVVAYAAGAEVSVVVQTRVDHNPASGIVRAAVENRISTLVIGWDGARSRPQMVFGTVIDQVLRRTDQLVFVARVGRSLSSIRRLVVVLPPGIEHNAGFPDAVHRINLLAANAGAPVSGLVVDGDPGEFERAFDRIKPEVSTAFVRVDGWDGLSTILRDGIDRDDLVVCASARRDLPGWHQELATLPKRISTLSRGDFVIVYLGTARRADDRAFLKLT